MNYDTFKKAYDTLSKTYQFIIFQFLQKIEHTKDKPNDKIDYSRGLKIALHAKELTINSLATIIEENTGIEDLRETIASMIERGSSSSIYFQDTLDILEIDEDFLIQNSEYFQSRIGNMKWCFESISKQNQNAIYDLMLQLANTDNITNFLEYIQNPKEDSDIGINAEDEDIPFFITKEI